MRRTLSSIFIVLSLVTAFAAFGVPVNTSWTYQGQLRRSGAAYNGTCNFQFSLWDAASAGTQQRSTQSINGVSVVNGLFTVTLDFAEVAPNGQVVDFSGDATWLATSVQCSGDGAGFTQLDPRQPITAAPYALSLRPGALIESSSGTTLLTVINHAYEVGISGSGGFAGLFGSANQPDGRGVFGTAYGQGPNSVGVFGYNESGAAISGRNGGTGPAILGENTSTGYAGQFTGPVVVAGYLSVDFSSHQGPGSAIAGFGSNIGVSGYGSSRGVYGTTSGNADSNSAGVFGENSAGPAIWGKSTGAGSAIYGLATSSGYAGRFTGTVVVEGNLVVTGGVAEVAALAGAIGLGCSARLVVVAAPSTSGAAAPSSSSVALEVLAGLPAARERVDDDDLAGAADFAVLRAGALGALDFVVVFVGI